MQKIYRDVCGLLLAVIRREARQVMESFIPNATKIQKVHAQHERRLQAPEKAAVREQIRIPYQETAIRRESVSGRRDRECHQYFCNKTERK